MEEKEIIKFHRESGDLIMSLYQVKYYPVAVKFIKPGGDTFGIRQTGLKKSICAFIKNCGRGESFYISRDNISCPGGLKWLGFPSKITESYFYKYFLGEVEKVKSSAEVAEKFIDNLPKPPAEGTYEKIIFTPLPKCNFSPDVVVLISNPRYAYQMITYAYLDEYSLVKTYPICAVCHGVITIPFVTGEVNINMIDPMSRRLGGYREEDVIMGIPYQKFGAFVKNSKENLQKPGAEPFLSKIIRKIID